MSEQIKVLLDALSEMQSQRSVIDLRKQEMIDSVLTPEIKQKVAEIEAEFSPQYPAVDENIARLTEQIKDAVLTEGATVSGEYLQAVWVKGRTSWDTKALEGYAAAHPEIMQFKAEGNPSVSIRKK